MQKKSLALLLCLLLVVTACGSFLTACNNEDDKVTILYLGDSIAEAVLGPSPLSERENYGYYAILGRCNNFNFYNRSVSGHKTEQLLQVIETEDVSAKMTHSLIKEADIIHVSILGNDLLQMEMSQIVYDFANGQTDTVDEITESALLNISAIVENLKILNPDAHLFFQNVYNPFCAESTLLTQEYLDMLYAQGYTADNLREIGADILSELNGVLSDYLETNPGAFYILDAQAEFDKIYSADEERGKRLIYGDFVHPSNEGHAVLAALSQRTFEELGIINKKQAKSAVANYRNIRIEQLERMFSDSTVDVKAVKKQLKAADSFEEITEIYFNAIRGVTPVYC